MTSRAHSVEKTGPYKRLAPDADANADTDAHADTDVGGLGDAEGLKDGRDIDLALGALAHGIPFHKGSLLDQRAREAKVSTNASVPRLETVNCSAAMPH